LAPYIMSISGIGIAIAAVILLLYRGRESVQQARASGELRGPRAACRLFWANGAFRFDSAPPVLPPDTRDSS
jgi:hypothetical protein